MSGDLADRLFADWQRDGVAAIERVRQETPTTYLRLIASVVSDAAMDEANPLAAMTDAELSRSIAALEAALHGEPR